jgi:hypothetical protein
MRVTVPKTETFDFCYIYTTYAMSFGPKPVNFALNRDMMGKILSHTREDMVTEVEKLTVETKNGHVITLAQARQLLSGITIRKCCESGCSKIVVDGPNTLVFNCGACGNGICYEHVWYQRNGIPTYACTGCKRDVCPCDEPIVYDDRRISTHRCDL